MNSTELILSTNQSTNHTAYQTISISSNSSLLRDLPVPIYPLTNDDYYPWDDIVFSEFIHLHYNSLDYHDFCEKVESLLARESEYSIVTHSYGGGLGHKYISIFHSVFVGLSSRRQWTGMYGLMNK